MPSTKSSTSRVYSTTMMTISPTTSDLPRATLHFPSQAFSVSYQAYWDNSVNPAWRNALAVCLAPAQWDKTVPPSKIQVRQEFAASVMQTH
ncbi:hypothetical protein J3F84DRAFT_370335, partial [Trichoderma pleuroticola]